MLINHLEHFLAEDDPEARALAVVALWQFDWQREATLAGVLYDMISSPFGSETFRQAAMAVGLLNVSRYRDRLRDAVVSDSRQTRQVAATALLNMGDGTGLPVLEAVLRGGSKIDAEAVSRLVRSRLVSSRHRTELEQMIHRYHLHYPSRLPVSEPLRIRLVDIPKDCLLPLKEYYDPASRHDEEELSKIDWATDNSKGAKVCGQVALVGLVDPWRSMAAVRLLAQGYGVRHLESASQANRGEAVVALPEAVSLPLGSVILGLNGEKPAKGHKVVQASHYAPSEIIQALSARRRKTI
jgi:hypothetical protein